MAVISMKTMNEENHMGWKLVSGVRRDVVNLFQLFASTNSIRFEGFCKVWKELNFSLIFSNRSTFTELLEFSEEILQIVKEYLFSIYEFHTRVASLYTLYGLYFKQPLIGAAKIRFTKTEWEEVLNLVEKSKEAQHYDVAFIFTKLYVSGAFSFTATVRPTGMERGYRKYSEKRSALHTKSCDVELLYRPLISEKLVNSLVKLESLYCRKKSELLGKRNLVFIDGKFAESLQEDLKNYKFAFQSEYSTKNKTQVNCETKNEGTSKMNEEDHKIGDTSHLGLTLETLTKRQDLEVEESVGGVPKKLTKFSKRYLEILSKKKAEFYIRKLQLEKSEQESKERKSILGLPELMEESADSEIRVPK